MLLYTVNPYKKCKNINQNMLEIWNKIVYKSNQVSLYCINAVKHENCTIYVIDTRYKINVHVHVAYVFLYFSLFYLMSFPFLCVLVEYNNKQRCLQFNLSFSYCMFPILKYSVYITWNSIFHCLVIFWKKMCRIKHIEW